MICSNGKAAGVDGGSGRSRSGFLSSSSLRSFASTAPSLSAVLGLRCTEGVPSGATSATRYEHTELIGFLSRVVPEFELIDVERQIFAARLVERANNAALEQRPEAFDCVGVNGADDVLAARVAHDFVVIAVLEVAVAGPIVRRQKADAIRDSLADELAEFFGADAIDDAGNDLALAGDRADDRRLAGANAALAAVAPAMPVVRFAADKRLVHFHNAEQLALGAVTHGDADTVAHIPSRLVGAGAEHPVDLVGAHALFRVVHQERDLEPLSQRVLGVLENRPRDDGEPIAVLVAALANPMERLALGLPDLGIATTRALDALGPAPCDQIGLAGVVVGEPGQEFFEVHHGAKNTPFPGWCQQPDNRRSVARVFGVIGVRHP